MSDQPPFDPPTFQPPAPQPPASSPFGAPAGPPEPTSPIAPKSNPWKPAAIGFGVAAVLGAAVFGVIQLTGDDDQVATQEPPVPSVTIPDVTMPPGAQEAIDDAEDVLASIPSIPVGPGTPSIPHGEPSDSAPPASAVPGSEDVPSGEDVTISIPDDMSFEAISECLGLGDLLGGLDLSDLDELAELGSVPMGSLPNFEEMSPEELAALDMDDVLKQVFGQMGSLPMGSLPFDLSILEDLELGELGDVAGMSPEEIQELIESQLGSLPSVPGMSVPPMSMPAPIDPAELQECLARVAP